jgi:hypothetical protein
VDLNGILPAGLELVFASDPTHSLLELPIDLLARGVFEGLDARGLATASGSAIRISASLTTFGAIKISLHDLGHCPVCHHTLPLDEILCRHNGQK